MANQLLTTLCFAAGRKKDKYGVITLDDEPWNRRWAAKIATDEEYFRELERTNPGQARNCNYGCFFVKKNHLIAWREN